MPIIGNPVTQSAFIADTFNGGQTVYSMSVAPANTASVIVAVHGLVQDPSTYAVNGNTLTFTAAPPSGTGNVSARYLGVPASGVVTTAYRTVTDFTATSGQTIFTPPSYTAGFIDVYRNGIKLGAADYTATNGTTITLSTASVAGDLVEIVSFYVSSVLNAIPATAGAVGSAYLAGNLILSGTTTASTITSAGATALTLQTNAGGTTAVTVLANGNVGVGTTNPARLLDVNGAANVTGNFTGTTGSFSSYLTMGSLVSADPGSNFYSFANRIGSTTGFQNGVSIGQGSNSYTAPPSNGILSYGNLQFNTTGAGVVFDQYSGQAGALVNSTLNDYETGTFSPYVSDGTTSVSLGTGQYVKIGKFVWVAIAGYNVNVSTLNAGTQLRITGLPFVNGVNVYANAIMAQNTPIVSGLSEGTLTTLYLWTVSNSVDYGYFTRNSWSGASNITFRFYYEYETTF